LVLVVAHFIETVFLYLFQMFPNFCFQVLWLSIYI